MCDLFLAKFDSQNQLYASHHSFQSCRAKQGEMCISCTIVVKVMKILMSLSVLHRDKYHLQHNIFQTHEFNCDIFGASKICVRYDQTLIKLCRLHVSFLDPGLSKRATPQIILNQRFE